MYRAEQHPQAGAVDVTQAGEIECDRGGFSGDRRQDLLLGGRGVRQVDLTGDGDTDCATAALDLDDGLGRRFVVSSG